MTITLEILMWLFMHSPQELQKHIAVIPVRPTIECSLLVHSLPCLSFLDSRRIWHAQILTANPNVQSSAICQRFIEATLHSKAYWPHTYKWRFLLKVISSRALTMGRVCTFKSPFFALLWCAVTKWKRIHDLGVMIIWTFNTLYISHS